MSWRQLQIFHVHWHHFELEMFFSSFKSSLCPQSEVEMFSLVANKPPPEQVPSSN